MLCILCHTLLWFNLEDFQDKGLHFLCPWFLTMQSCNVICEWQHKAGHSPQPVPALSDVILVDMRHEHNLNRFLWIRLYKQIELTFWKWWVYANCCHCVSLAFTLHFFLPHSQNAWVSLNWCETWSHVSPHPVFQ